MCGPGSAECTGKYAYYEGEWPKLPDVKVMAAVATGEVATFDSGVRKRGRDYALQFTGFIEAPADGVYTFWVGADDGARLQIGEQTVVEHLDPRASREERGQIMLKAGKHPITVTYHQASGGQRLEVSWAGPGVERAAIAGEALWRSPAGAATK